MPQTTIPVADLAAYAAMANTAHAETASNPVTAARDVSIWEITTWILPMTPEHLRRVLGQNPDLPQGRAGIEGGTRWFTMPQVERLRQHFASIAARHTGQPGRRSKGFTPQRPTGAQAPLVVLTGPQGRVGRSTGLLHLAVAAALGGYRILVLDADPGGRLAAQLGVIPDQDANMGATILPLIARSCGVHLRQLNAGRMDRGEAPLPMDEVIAAALEQDATALIRPTVWPGLDVIAATPDLLLGDSQIATWRSALRSWHPAKALAAALDREGLRDRYDLILCDTGRGLGPLVLAVLTSADVLLLSGMASDAARTAGGLVPLARALQIQDSEATMTARALGQPALRFGWRRIVAMPVDSAIRRDGLTVAPLPHPLPLIPQVANGQAAHFYALDYRDVGRLTYAPLRDACDATWQGLAGVLADLWAEDATSISESKTAQQSL